MKLILTKIQLKQKGWFSWLFNKQFNLKINNETFKLKTGSDFLCYIIEISTFDVNIKIDIDNIIYDYSKTFKLGESTIEVDNPCFKGIIYFNTVYGNLMTYLENTKSKDKTVELGRNLHNSTEIYGVRISYENQEYYVNKENYTTSFTKSIQSTFLPPGWDTAVYNKKILYVNHSSKLCYWKSPAFLFTALRDRIDHFENILSSLNFLSFRNLIPIKLDVKREHILDSTALYLLKNVDKLRSKKIHVSFVDEMGQDYGALLREFIYETSLEIFNDSRLQLVNDFVDVKPTNFCQEDKLDISVKELSLKHDVIIDYPDILKGKNRLDDETFYTYLGVFLAIIILINENIDYSFSLCFYENLLKRNYNIRIIQDKQYQKSLLFMLNNDVDEDILPGVNSNNKSDLVYSIMYDKLYLQKRIPYEFIRKGFYSVIPESFQDIFESDELALLISNDKNLEVNTLKDFVLYNMCSIETQEVIWLWEILSGKDQIFLRRFLKFITGSGSIPMLINNSNFRIVIEKNNAPDILFRASACLNKLFIGCYQSKDDMDKILEFSVLNTEGFHKV